jgi:hypothetical protein
MATEKLSSIADVMGSDSTNAQATAMAAVVMYVMADASRNPNASKYASNL